MNGVRKFLHSVRYIIKRISYIIRMLLENSETSNLSNFVQIPLKVLW